MEERECVGCLLDELGVWQQSGPQATKKNQRHAHQKPHYCKCPLNALNRIIFFLLFLFLFSHIFSFLVTLFKLFKKSITLTTFLHMNLYGYTPTELVLTMCSQGPIGAQLLKNNNNNNCACARA